jgi:nucleoside-diphosphate-sugar epimerase
MRVAVFGATGNVGTSVLEALAAEPAVESVLAIARREPKHEPPPKAEWAAADIVRDDLRTLLAGVDTVVHLAWLIQPARDQKLLRTVNIDGSRRVFDAVASAGVHHLVYASSVGAYSPGPKDPPVDESWPTHGVPNAYYSQQKAAVERVLDQFEESAPQVRVVRLRPGLIFKRSSALEQQRLFAGPYLPKPLLVPGRLPFIPLTDRLRFQAVHADDVADAYRRAIVSDLRGAFNIAAPDVIGPPEIAALLKTRAVMVPERVLRALVTASFRMRLQPSPADWFNMGVEAPVMDVSRASAELGWRPRVSAQAALEELLEGIRNKDSGYTPPLAENPVSAAR